MTTTNAMMCPQCGIEMNYHAEKIDYMTALTDPGDMDPDLGGVLEEIHTCPGCGQTGARRAASEEP
jgi:predicted RNA-binding Zn-ribbon protein involved in translation (DUF1610 family)